MAVAAQPAHEPPGPSRTVQLAPGPWDPRTTAPDAACIGFLVTDGLLTRDLTLAHGVARDLVGPGDLAALEPEEAALLTVRVHWRVNAAARVTYLDETLVAELERRPELTRRLLGRAATQSGREAMHRAISQLPRVDQRLVGLLWLLAERWGRVGRDAVVLPITLTHEALGQMVGARRPTVSLALKELAQTGAVTRRSDGAWLLAAGSQALAALGEEPSAQGAPDAVLLGEVAPALAEAPRQRSAAIDVEALARRVGNLAREHDQTLDRMRRARAETDAARSGAEASRDAVKAGRRGRPAPD